MALDQKIILFDLASKDGNKCWSYNPWKTRFALNFKKLDYTTEFLEYPSLETRLSPHLPGADAYTSPTIAYTDGRYIPDSRVIADVLDKDHPSPPLHLDSAYLDRLERRLPDIVQALRPEIMAQIPVRLLNEASVPYWYRTREDRAGMKLQVLEETQGGDKAWTKAAPLLREVTDWLGEKDGPFFLGETVSYADFVWAGFLLFLGRVGDDKLDALLEHAGDAKVHRALLAAVKPWSERDDH